MLSPGCTEEGVKVLSLGGVMNEGNVETKRETEIIQLEFSGRRGERIEESSGWREQCLQKVTKWQNSLIYMTQGPPSSSTA